MGLAASAASLHWVPSLQSDLRLIYCEYVGTEYIDQITIAPGLVIPQQSIGVASQVICIFEPFFKSLIFHANFSQQVSMALTVSLGKLGGTLSDIDADFF